MSGIETALLSVGRAVVTPFFRQWLGGRRQHRDRQVIGKDRLPSRIRVRRS